MSPRRACRKDANHDEIADAIRLHGWQVYDTFQVAQYLPGWPDLLACREGETVWVEVKTARGRLTADERKFQAVHRGRYVVLRSVDDVLREMGRGDAGK